MATIKPYGNGTVEVQEETGPGMARRVAVLTLNELARLWEKHKPAVAHEARTLEGALVLCRKHGVSHPYEAIEQEAKARAIAEFRASLPA